MQTPVTAPVHFVRCTFKGVDGAVLRGAGPVHLTDCTLTGAENAAPLSVGSADLRIDGGTYDNTGIELSGVRDQRITVTGGARFTGSNKAEALLGRAAGPGGTTWDITGLSSRATGAAPPTSASPTARTTTRPPAAASPAAPSTSPRTRSPRSSTPRVSRTAHGAARCLRPSDTVRTDGNLVL